MVWLPLIPDEVTRKKRNLKSVEQGNVHNLLAHGLNGFFNQVKRSSGKIGGYQHISHTVMIKINNDVYSSKAGTMVLEALKRHLRIH